jgi:hypothetical protein
MAVENDSYDGSDVYVAFPTGGHTTPEFTVSLVKLQRRWPRMELGYAKSSRLVNNRNELVRLFLASGREWMLNVDDDMLFEPEQVEEMVMVAEQEGAKVVGGLAFGDDGGMIFSTAMVRNPAGLGYLKAASIPEGKVLQPVDATGGALLLVHRSVLEKISKRHKNRTPYQWFEETVKKGQAFGEDVTFCERVKDVGEKVYIYTGAKTGHVKERILTHDTFRRQQFFEKFVIYGTRQSVLWLAAVMNYMGIGVAQPGADPIGWRGISIITETEDVEVPDGFSNAATVNADQVIAASNLPAAVSKAAKAAGTMRSVQRADHAIKTIGIPTRV